MHLKTTILSAFILLASFAGRAQIVVIDAGHGYNSDCSNGDGRTETEINTAHNVSHKLKDMIDTTCAWTTHLTRPNNGCGSWVSITQRYIMANNWNADIFLSIHCNAGGGSGTETFWCDLAAPPDIDDENYAIEIQNQMVAYGQWIDRRVVEDDSYLPFHLGVLRNLTMNGCLSEIGFVDTGDSVKLLNNNWRIEFARAYHDGLQNYLGIQCSTPNTLDCANAVQLQCGTTYSGPQASPGSDVNSYGCNNWTETGPERVHSITPLVSGTLTATISNFTGDLDVFILGSCDPSDCLGTVSSSQAVFTNAVAGNTYYIVVDADDGSTSAYDLNVTCSGSAPGQADLTCVFQNLYPSAVSSNDTVEAHVEIQNIGGDTATNYELTFYLSLDSTIDISDSIIGNFLINQHLPLTTLSDTFELAIPSGWNTNAVVIASVDDNAVVNEADENNNQCYQLISISQSPSEILDCGSAINLQCGVTYQGPIANYASEVTTYGCNNWTETGPERVHSITPSFSGTLTATISNFTGDLDVYILGSCDPSDCLGSVSSSQAVFSNAVAGQTYYIVVDADDGSNSAYDLIVDCAIPAQPDLSCTFQSIQPTQVNTNDSILAFLDIHNNGNDTASNYHVTFYISSDSIIDITDSVLGDFIINQHLPLVTLVDSFQMTIPTGWSGNAVIIASVDDNSDVTEADETNNLCYQTISVTQPTVEILDCSNPVVLQCGVPYSGPASNDSSEVTSYGCNNWTETGPERVHQITISDSGSLTATLTNFTGDLDVYILGSCDPSDCLGTVSSSSANYPSAAPGTYYIVVDADDGSGSSYDLLVTCPSSIDLSPQLLAFSDTSTINGNFNFSVATKNSGTDTAFNFITSYYLSLDAIVDSQDLVLHIDSFSQVLPGSAVNKSHSVSVPNTISAGNYFFISFVDSDTDISESFETNNIIAKSVYIANPLSTATGLENIIPKWNIYPNPSSREFIIEIGNGNVEYELFNSLGQLEMTGILSKNINEISWKNIPNGIFYLTLKDEQHTRSFKLIHN